MKRFKRPNILLIYTDQQRLDTLSCLNENSPIQTKNMDYLASRGANFSKCFVQSPVCAPSRMSFLSGRYCSSVGVGTNGIAFPEDKCVPVNKILKDYGYDTAQIGKIHFQPHAKRDARDIYPNYGFDHFVISDEPGCYDDAYTKWVEMVAPDEVSKVRTSLPPAALFYGKPEYSTVPRNTHEPYDFEAADDLSHSAFVASEMCNYLEARDGKKPFFAIAGFYAPHTPVNPPKSCLDRVDESKIKMPIPIEKEKVMDELKDLTDADWKKIIKYYLALTVHVDDCVGEIIESLEKSGQMDDTIIIFTSDHGEYLGDYGRIQKGMPGYDCITNIPMMISYPGKIAPNTCFHGLIESVDMVPTILDYCGIQSPRDIQGKSLKPLLEGKVNTHKDVVLTENFVPYGLKETTIRTNAYKYYCNSKGDELLFDLEKDHDEVVNVVCDDCYTEVLKDMRKKMIMKVQEASYANLEQDAEY